jgi:hypothetical protein
MDWAYICAMVMRTRASAAATNDASCAFTAGTVADLEPLIESPTNEFLDHPHSALEASYLDVPPPLQREMAPYFMDIVDKRRADRREDLLSGLMAAEVDGERLTVGDLLQFCWLLLVAGNVTTANLIGNAILTFLDLPGLVSSLRSDEALLIQAIEEVWRFRSAVQMMFRITTCHASWR